ncbi:MAG: hypothetical protein KGP12_03175 [Actinomycetales bacterium]|nr:hypothetical protein [Actinomycetales bacterium]
MRGVSRCPRAGIAIRGRAIIGPVLAIGLSITAAPLIGHSSALAAKPATRTITTFVTIEQRSVVPLGASPGGAGDLTSARGVAAWTDSGPAVGGFASKVMSIVPGVDGRERRNTTVNVSLPEGALFAQQIQDGPIGRPPDGPSTLVILGGTGAYRNARGVVSLVPVRTSVLKYVWTLLPSTGINPEHATTLAFQRVVDATVLGQADDNSSRLTVDGTEGVLRLRGQDGRFTCGDTTFAQARPGGIGVDSWICRCGLPRGSVLVSTLSQVRNGMQSPTTVEDIILGGTGAYAGARGVAVTTRTSDTTADVTLRLLDPTGSPAVPVRFTQERSYRTFGVMQLGGGTRLLAGSTGSQRAPGSDRPIGTSQGLYVSSFDGPATDGQRVSFGVTSLNLKGGSIRAVAFDTGLEAQEDATRTLVVTGGTGIYVGVTGTIGVVPQRGPSDRMVARLAQ